METVNLKEFHWMMDMLHSIDVGLVVIDRKNQVQMWNRFMANHSGVVASQIVGKDLLSTFPYIPAKWLEKKIETVATLRSRAFTTWEQRPYLFRFRNYRPITGTAEFMFQNVTFIPLTSTDSEIHHIGIIVYDVTGVAVNKEELEAANEQLAVVGRTDMLTQLYNRGYWEDCLSQEFRRYKRTQQTCSLVIFDIDHFKKVNDTYGHQAGDEVIRHTAQTLLDEIRETDIAGRYGGEEFTVLLIDTDQAGALYFCERLRKQIEASRVKFENQEIAYTISLGICEAEDEIEDYMEWLGRADQSLYQAKHDGRNRSIAYNNI
jgi:diguanylate cyclase (GGDEF)-like protein